MESQNKQIKSYLEQGNTITAITALEKFKCFRLASRITDLKESGMQIGSQFIKLENGKLLMINTSRYDFYDYPNKLITFIPKFIDEASLPEGDVNEFAKRAAEDGLLPFFGESIFTNVMGDYWVRNGRDADGNLLKSKYLN